MKTRKDFLSVLILVAAMAMTFMQASCTKDDSSVEQPVEYNKVFTYTYEGQMLYYVIDSLKQSAWVVAPVWPNLADIDVVSGTSWIGYDDPEGDVTIPAEVEYCGKRFPVTDITNGAFFRCPDITNVTLPQSITFIGQSSFDGCTSLQSINLPEGLTKIRLWAFADCHSLKEITLPSTLKIIEDCCFVCDTLLLRNKTHFPQHTMRGAFP